MPPPSATYQEIQKWVREHHGFVPKTCWIAHCKEIYGLPVGAASNRQGEERTEPYPPDKIPALTQAFRHFGLLG
jgi:hypothetical protein